MKYYWNTCTHWKFMAWTMLKPLCALWPWPSPRSWHFLGSRPNNSVNYYSNLCIQWKLMVRTRLKPLCALRPWNLTSDLGSRSQHFLGSRATVLWNIIPTHALSENLWSRQSKHHCALWPWHLTSDLGSRSWHFLGCRPIFLWNIISIHALSENLWSGQA